MTLHVIDHRTSSVVLVGKDGHVTFTERTRVDPEDPSSQRGQWTTRTFNFNLNFVSHF